MSLNYFQTSLIEYAGFTGSTGGTVVPDFPTGYTLAGSATITGATGQIDIPVPSTAKNIVIMAKDLDLTAGSIACFVASSVGSFGVDIIPSGSTPFTDQQVLTQIYSPNGLTWVGVMNIGKINTTTEGKTEMLGGTLLAPLLGVIISNPSSDFTAGQIWVLYQ